MIKIGVYSSEELHKMCWYTIRENVLPWMLPTRSSQRSACVVVDRALVDTLALHKRG